MECRCSGKELTQPLQKLEELIEAARRVYKSANDPISAVVRFLHERPEDQSISGYVISKVLLETFESPERIPQLVNILAGHAREIVRKRNVIELIKEHPGLEKWGNYVIKQTDRIKFEIGREKDRLVLKDIVGLLCVEHGVELPLDKILINPPKLEVTFRLGLLRPQKIVDIA